MRSWKLFVPVLLICSVAFASESRLPFSTVFKGQDQFNRLVAKAKSGNWKALPIGERTATVGQALVGTRYKHFTLEIDNRIESPSVNFQGWTVGRFSRSRSASRECSTGRKQIGLRSNCCITSSWTDIAAANARANIFRVCIIWRTGFTTTTAVASWMI